MKLNTDQKDLGLCVKIPKMASFCFSRSTGIRDTVHIVCIWLWCTEEIESFVHYLSCLIDKEMRRKSNFKPQKHFLEFLDWFLIGAVCQYRPLEGEQNAQREVSPPDSRIVPWHILRAQVTAPLSVSFHAFLPFIPPVKYVHPSSFSFMQLKPSSQFSEIYPNLWNTSHAPNHDTEENYINPG